MTEEHHLQAHDALLSPAELNHPWELIMPIENTGICSGVSAVEFNNKIHAFFVFDDPAGYVGVSYLVFGYNAEKKLTVEKQEYLNSYNVARHRPAVTVHGGRLFCFYTSLEKTVNYHEFSDGRWTQGEQVPGVLTDHAPSVFSTGEKLHLAVQGTNYGEFYHKVFENDEWGRTVNALGIAFKGSPSLGGNSSKLFAAVTGLDNSIKMLSYTADNWQLDYESPYYKVQGSPTLFTGDDVIMCTSINAHDQHVVTEFPGMKGLDTAHPVGVRRLAVTHGKYLSEPCLIKYREQLYLIGRRPCDDVGVSLYKSQVIG